MEMETQRRVCTGKLLVKQLGKALQEFDRIRANLSALANRLTCVHYILLVQRFLRPNAYLMGGLPDSTRIL
ncbi:hypothetical protein LEP3755_27210 [Leptolyngbya sp. NIES-3755]|nr:hypothetical protein LEP3755_27210 [Leptolyngbya sp. NIES-3755]